MGGIHLPAPDAPGAYRPPCCARAVKGAWPSIREGESAPHLSPDSSMDSVLLLGGLLASAAALRAGPTEQDSLPSCPPLCRCSADGLMLWVDCSELGLSAVPGGMSPFTTYLDLSMNNISEIQPSTFSHLRFLEELRLSGNQLSMIPWQAFSGLYSLKVLMLQNNQLRRIPAEALRDLPNLQSLTTNP